ncbi:MAG: glycosyltransferase family 4 protein [Sphingobacteriales bacterium]|nr:MAG: glycosyltransferase family 4 protein [Sphingobacteriales bacterium]
MKKTKKILFLSPYPFGTAPSQRLKYEQYYDALQQNGFSITTRSFVSLNFWKIIYQKGFLFLKIAYTLFGYLGRFFDLLTIRKYDVVYIHLWVTPLGLPIFEYLVCLFAKKVIYDIDDMIYLQQDSSRFIDKIKGRKKPIILMKKANHVIVCSPFLRDFVSKYNKNISVILATYDTEKSLPIKNHIEKDIISIGWTGTHSTLKYLEIIRPIIAEIAAIRKIEFLVICNAPYHTNNINIKNIHWTAENELDDLRKIDIGVYPLEKEEWVLGKSGNKALAYMNLSIPCVATNFGTNQLVIQNGENGFLADNAADWKKYLLLLIDSAALRERIGIAARMSVENYYSVKNNTQTYIDILSKSV